MTIQSSGSSRCQCSLFVRYLACSLARNEIGADGAKHLAAGLKKNGALTSLKYATNHPFAQSVANAKCQHPLTVGQEMST